MAVDINGVVLKSILDDPKGALEIWPKLKLCYFGTSYASIYVEINRYYNKHSSIPNFNELLVITRNSLIKNNIKALSTLEIPEDIDLDIAFEALVNEYAQNEALSKIDELLDSITLLDASEIITNLSDTVMYLEEKTHSSENVYLMSDIILIDEEVISNRVCLGLNNEHDIETLGVGYEDLILIGGPRGSGKSVICCNATINQYKMGNVVPYFTIEMRARSVYDRIMAALAEVNHQDLMTGRSSQEDKNALVKVRCELFVDATQAYHDYILEPCDSTLERTLATKKLKPDNQIIIIDNQRLTLADIDLNIHKLKAQYGDKLKVVVIDYLNAINIEDIYSWESQLLISKVLKDLCEKYGVVIIAPYQVTDKGETRFSKAILDKADIAAILKATKGENPTIQMKSTKTRNIPEFEYSTVMNWDTLRLSGATAPNDVESSEEEGDSSKPTKNLKEDLNF